MRCFLWGWESAGFCAAGTALVSAWLERRWFFPAECPYCCCRFGVIYAIVYAHVFLMLLQVVCHLCDCVRAKTNKNAHKKKLLEKQKAGKKRMRQFGSVEIPQNAFFEALKMGDN